MSVSSDERSALESLAAARLRDARADELLDLADAAIEQATTAADRLSLDLIAAELESAATAHPEAATGLRVAAARARVALPPSPRPPSETAPEPAERPPAAVDRHASWGSRLVAWLIDWGILLVAALLITSVAGDPAGSLAWTVGAFTYFGYLNGRGGTPGKQLLRIKVVDASSGAPIGSGRGAVRELVRLALTFLTLGIGFILDGLRPLWDENHQSWHDAAAKSIVIRR